MEDTEFIEESELIQDTKLVEQSKLEFECKELNLNIETILKQYIKYHEFINNEFHSLYDEWYKEYCRPPVCWQEVNAVVDSMYILFEMFNDNIKNHVPECELTTLFKNCNDMLLLGNIIEDLEYFAYKSIS